MWQFDNDGKLRSFANQQQKFLSNLMLRRGLLTSEDTIGQSSPMSVSGNARSFLNIKSQDSIPIDSLAVEEEFEL